MFAGFELLANWLSRNGINPPKVTLTFPTEADCDLFHETLGRDVKALDPHGRETIKTQQIRLFGIEIRPTHETSDEEDEFAIERANGTMGRTT